MSIEKISCNDLGYKGTLCIVKNFLEDEISRTTYNVSTWDDEKLVMSVAFDNKDVYPEFQNMDFYIVHTDKTVREVVNTISLLYKRLQNN